MAELPNTTNSSNLVPADNPIATVHAMAEESMTCDEDPKLRELSEIVKRLEQENGSLKDRLEVTEAAKVKAEHLHKAIVTQRDRFLIDLTDSQCESLEIGDLLLKERDRYGNHIADLHEELANTKNLVGETTLRLKEAHGLRVQELEQDIKDAKVIHSEAYTKEFERRKLYQDQTKAMSDYLKRVQLGGEEMEGFPENLSSPMAIYNFYKELEELNKAKPKRKAPAKRKKAS